MYPAVNITQMYNSPGVMMGGDGYGMGYGGDGFESLRNQLRYMKTYGVKDKKQLDRLQEMYPGVNVTQMYNNPAMMMGEEG